MENAFKSSFNIAGIGEILFDNLPDGRRLGGAPANFAIHCSLLGAESKVVSSVGNDSPGREIIKMLNDKGIDTSCISVNEHPTGSVDVKLCPAGQPEYIINENAAWDYISLNRQTLEVAKNCDAVCFGSLAQRNEMSKTSILNFLEAAGENCLKVFDVNLRQHYYSKEIIENSLKLANILKLNDEELNLFQQMFALKDKKLKAIDYLLDTFDLELVALTVGDKGSVMVSKDDISLIKAEPAEVKDTVGAGDCFTAVMVYSLLCRLSIEEANEFASRAASFVCSQDGATPRLPENILAEMKNRQKNTLQK
ncbi:carbohydrate kinase family protein [Sedimentisphaera salicampi]|uniref:carbohydrate kinase family protein n=1 Tax=Sedimentisphaera salicampi TaxID=1941349 RepID=UPI000B9B7D59|nr:carbohydrate kinase [Sedimentisphaera salicampi]OXU15513.1 5-dehydro-2-deoxygluconokinase [Sedimentisphaera salicampi]